MKRITREEFNVKMKEIHEKYKNDPECLHIEADKLLCTTLISLGYDAGINVFTNMISWYA